MTKTYLLKCRWPSRCGRVIPSGSTGTAYLEMHTGTYRFKDAVTGYVADVFPEYLREPLAGRSALQP